MVAVWSLYVTAISDYKRYRGSLETVLFENDYCFECTAAFWSSSGTARDEAKPVGCTRLQNSFFFPSLSFGGAGTRVLHVSPTGGDEELPTKTAFVARCSHYCTRIVYSVYFSLSLGVIMMILGAHAAGMTPGDGTWNVWNVWHGLKTAQDNPAVFPHIFG